ncbi:MAG: BLUF domain-containing protein [Pseudomonadota bacterium]
MAMQQLIYYSRPFGFDAAMLANILESSRRRNRMNDVTGALVCRADIFCQLLEGPVGKVEATFNRIEQDDRHVEVQVLVRCLTQDRLFEHWAMYHDPQPNKLWSPDEVHSGVPQRATVREVRHIFLSVAQAVNL